MFAREWNSVVSTMPTATVSQQLSELARCWHRACTCQIISRDAELASLWLTYVRSGATEGRTCVSLVRLAMIDGGLTHAVGNRYGDVFDATVSRCDLDMVLPIEKKALSVVVESVRTVVVPEEGSVEWLLYKADGCDGCFQRGESNPRCIYCVGRRIYQEFAVRRDEHLLGAPISWLNNASRRRNP